MRFWFLALVLATSSVRAQTGTFSYDSLCNRAMTSYKQPGMAMGVIENGSVVFSKGYGKRNLERNESIDDHTVFPVASLSKAFTAAAIGILVDRGMLKWDDKVISHDPSFALYDPQVTHQFTVRDLLCHRNGYETFDGDLLWYGTKYSREEIVNRFSRLKPKHGFREKYGYSNIMFIEAAVLIEKKTGMSWESFVRQHILKPLEMTETVVDHSAFLLLTNKATPHVNGAAQSYINYNNAAGAVGVNSNVADLLKWATMWLNQGTYKGKVILKESTVRELFAAKTVQQVSPKNEENGIHFKAAASGWMVQDLKGFKMVHHSGGLPGFILNLALLPEKKSAVVVLTNGETALPFALTNTVMDLHIAGKSKDYLPNAGQNGPDAGQKPIAPHKISFSDTLLLGNYQDLMYGGAKIFKQNGRLTLELSPTATLFTAELTPCGPAHFRFKFKDPFLPEGTLVVQFNPQGGIKSFTIDLPNPDFNFYNLLFTKQP